ncbi:MAG: hypothetical protein HPKKFMNG_02807 [Planctomycetes bacterium]|nr:hypothetical protein [Planctomycetota bacterium]
MNPQKIYARKRAAGKKTTNRWKRNKKLRGRSSPR